jgi:hypothetical protein
MSLDSDTFRLVCDRCTRVETGDDDLYDWTLTDAGTHICAGCRTTREQAAEEAAAERLKRLIRDPSGVAILKMVIRDWPASAADPVEESAA